MIGNGWVLVDFWATWCPPCKAMSPIVDNLAVSLAGRVDVVKIDIDTGDWAEKYDIRSAPTFVMFKDGIEVSRLTGAVGLVALTEFVEKALTVGV